jgi:hypothetical protein
MKCICCDTNVKASIHNSAGEIKTEEDAIFITEVREYEDGKKTYIRAENRMWNNGIVANISAGYGSTLDGGVYVLAICDDCTRKKQLDGTIAHTGDYMSPDYYKKDDEEKARQVWRRYNQLDNLLSDTES